MRYKIDEDKYSKELKKLSQLDRIEFKQNLTYYISERNNNYAYLRSSIIIFICFSTMIIAASLIDITLALFIIAPPILIIIEYWIYYRNDVRIEKLMKECYEQYFNRGVYGK